MNYTAADADAGDRLRAVGASIGLAFGGLFVSLVLLVVAQSLLAGAGILLTQDTTPLVTYPVATVVQGAGFVLVVAGFVWLFDDRGLLRVRRPTLRELLVVVGGLVALIAALAGVSAVYARLDIATAQNQIVRVGREYPRLMLYMLPLAVLVVGPTEELLFRGAIQGLLRRAYAAAPAILLASVFFALAHATALAAAATPGAKAATLSAILVLSLVLGALYEYTDNLVVPALVHGLYDVFVFGAIYVEATGGL